MEHVKTRESAQIGSDQHLLNFVGGGGAWSGDIVQLEPSARFSIAILDVS